MRWASVALAVALTAGCSWQKVVDEERSVVAQESATAMPTASPAPTPDRRWIPGMKSINVTANLEESPRNFKCTRKPESDTPSGFRSGWECRGTIAGAVAVLVRTISRSDDEIERILVSAAVARAFASRADELAGPVLGFIATLPYDRAEPLVARRWVEENVASPQASRSISGASFVLGKVDALTYTMEIRSLGFVAAP